MILQQLVFDPQTSGGLLLSVEKSVADEMLAILSRRFPAARKVGSVYKPEATALRFS
jgi:hypothetical protein